MSMLNIKYKLHYFWTEGKFSSKSTWGEISIQNKLTWNSNQTQMEVKSENLLKFSAIFKSDSNLSEF